MSDQNDLWVAMGKVQRTQAEQGRVIEGLIASVQRLEAPKPFGLGMLPPFALVEDRSPEQLAADGDQPPQRQPQRQVIFEHEGKAHWLCGCCGTRFPVAAEMVGLCVSVGLEVVATVCQPCLPALREKVDALFPHPQVVQ